ncbi:hypothetical protein Btru_072212 [Bulinus truncatus]|nr:hypothetical protein Btru_072212 [Bulinus truncatus]
MKNSLFALVCLLSHPWMSSGCFEGCMQKFMTEFTSFSSNDTIMGGIHAGTNFCSLMANQITCLNSVAPQCPPERKVLVQNMLAISIFPDYQRTCVNQNPNGNLSLNQGNVTSGSGTVQTFTPTSGRLLLVCGEKMSGCQRRFNQSVSSDGTIRNISDLCQSLKEFTLCYVDLLSSECGHLVNRNLVKAMQERHGGMCSEGETYPLCFQLVDTLIQQSALSTFSDLTNAVDITVTTEAPLLQSFLDAFVEAADSPYGCLFSHGRVLVATSKWWELSPTELSLLSLLMLSLPHCSSRDVPIYLPQASPTIPHRLMTFELIKNLEVCVICGPTPTLSQLTREISRFWTPAIETLKSARQTYPRNFPVTLDVDINILGFILVNTKTHRCLSSVNINREREDTAKLDKRRAVLRSFFKYVVGTYFSNSNIKGTDKGPSEFSHQVTDTYIVCSGHKCYALMSGSYQIFVMFTTRIPTFAMRIEEKSLIHWAVVTWVTSPGLKIGQLEMKIKSESRSELYTHGISIISSVITCLYFFFRTLLCVCRVYTKIYDVIAHTIICAA